ncbi:hypothetical protein TcasGA2_TC032914 [Tribolium castaneum]|uniref:Uncharacterized protein n=1 Tax=Tribolium castaneum TaxID=7070 RepID=A0A139WJN4_TRICA|nr:hypothetical protein TcasGA2_TC032914 [Tribolium castaneum]
MIRTECEASDPVSARILLQQEAGPGLKPTLSRFKNFIMIEILDGFAFQ